MLKCMVRHLQLQVGKIVSHKFQEQTSREETSLKLMSVAPTNVPVATSGALGLNAIAAEQLLCFRYTILPTHEFYTLTALRESCSLCMQSSHASHDDDRMAKDGAAFMQNLHCAKFVLEMLVCFGRPHTRKRQTSVQNVDSTVKVMESRDGHARDNFAVDVVNQNLLHTMCRSMHHDCSLMSSQDALTEMIRPKFCRGRILHIVLLRFLGFQCTHCMLRICKRPRLPDRHCHQNSNFEGMRWTSLGVVLGSSNAAEHSHRRGLTAHIWLARRQSHTRPARAIQKSAESVREKMVPSYLMQNSMPTEFFICDPQADLIIALSVLVPDWGQISISVLLKF